MKKINLILLCMAAGFANSAIAEGQWVFGAGSGVINTPYKQYQKDIVFVPVVSYEGERLWLGGPGGGYYLWKDKTNLLSLTAYYDPSHFKPGDSDSRLLRKLDKRRSSVMAGISFEHHTDYGVLRTSFAGDTIRNSNGFVGDMAWLYRYNFSRFSVQPGLGVHYYSNNYNNYYYGVSGKESSRSGLKAYNASDSWSPYIELKASYNFTGNWSIYSSGSYEKISKTVDKSPMVDKSWSGALSAGFTYHF